MDFAINEMDNRIVELSTAKADQSTVLNMVSGWEMDEKTGIITVTKLNGEQIVFDMNVEKIPVSFELSEDGILKMITDDGTVFTANIGDMIPVLTFNSSSTINVIVTEDENGKSYTFEVKDGSITEDKLQPNYLAEIKVESANAVSASASASEDALSAEESASEAKQYRDEAEQFRNEAFTSTPDGYQELIDKVDGLKEKEGLDTTTSASGENIHLTDSTDNKATAFALYGKATQGSTTGKNLTDMTGVANSYKLPKTLPSGTYTVSFKSTGTIGGFRMSNAIDTSTNSVAKNNTPNSDGYIVITLTTEYETNYTNLSSDGDVSEIMLSEGSSYVPYEPYTGGIASPNPDYPQEIEVAGASGSVDVKSVGKNLLENTATSQGFNGVTFTVNEDGSITVNGTATAATSFVFCEKLILPHGEYIMSSGHTANYPIMTSSTVYTDGTSISDGVTNRIGNFTVDDTVNYLARIRLYIPIDKTVENVKVYPMVRLASDTDDTYEPYKETTSAVSTPNGLPGIPVSSGGNYTDENGQQWICDSIVKYADGTGKYVQRVGKYVFTGSDDEGWGINNQVFSVTAVATNRSGNKEATMCSNHKNNPDAQIITYATANSYLSDGEFSFRNSGVVNYYTIYFKNSLITDVEEFKNLMLGAELYYELAEPIITDITAEEIAEIEKLQTFYPVTNISNDADCGTEVEYITEKNITTQTAIEFSNISQSEVLESGDTVPTAFAKIKKFMEQGGSGTTDQIVVPTYEETLALLNNETQEVEE